MNQMIVRHGGAKLRILEAAEALFARNGLEAVSIRHITAAAPANVAAVNYHFGNRDGLIMAVVGRYLSDIDKARLARLETIRKEDSNDAVAEILRAFAEPLITHVFRTEQSRDLFRGLAARIAAGTEREPNDFRPEGSPVIATFSRALGWHFPAIPEMETEQILRAATRDLVSMAADELERAEGENGTFARQHQIIEQFVRRTEESFRSSL